MAARSVLFFPAKNEPSPERKKREMKKTTLKTRLWALAATLLLLVSLLAMPTSAENVAPTTNLETTFDKYLVMDTNANVPNVEFEFKITAGAAANATTGSSRSIYAGDDALRVEGFPVLKVDGTGNTTTAKVNFVAGDTTTYDRVQDGDILVLGEKEKYAKKTVTVDFNAVDFNAPGIYRYIITEKTDETQQGISYDNPNTRTLDVFVEYVDPDTGGALKVTSYVLYPGTKTDASVVAEEAKDDGFTNTYTTYDLTLAKTVTGNQGDRDKFFKFTVTISNAVPGTVYDVTIPTTDAPTQNDLEQGDSIDNVNLDKLTVGSAQAPETTGSVTATYYIKHNQSIVIQGLTSDTAYTITETDYSTDGYTTTYAIDGGEPVTAIATPSENNTMNGADHTVTFTNHKQGTVPTGILLETAPYLILGAVVVAGLVVLFATRRRRTRE